MGNWSKKRKAIALPCEMCYKSIMDTGVIIAIVLLAVFGEVVREWTIKRPASYLSKQIEQKLSKDSLLRKILTFKVGQ
jgi:hypothetical protein